MYFLVESLVCTSKTSLTIERVFLIQSSLRNNARLSSWGAAELWNELQTMLRGYRLRF
jgi:hypothetical protein